MAVLGLVLLALVVKILAELEGDAAPPFESEERGGTSFHTAVAVEIVPTGHARSGASWLRTATQALLVAALTGGGAGAMFTHRRTN